MNLGFIVLGEENGVTLAMASSYKNPTTACKRHLKGDFVLDLLLCNGHTDNRFVFCKDGELSVGESHERTELLTALQCLDTPELLEYSVILSWEQKELAIKPAEVEEPLYPRQTVLLPKGFYSYHPVFVNRVWFSVNIPRSELDKLEGEMERSPNRLDQLHIIYKWFKVKKTK